MTDYVTEMMETAGIKPKIIASYTFKCGYNKKQYEKDIIEYPDFTAEKQLELIKLIALFDFEISIDIDKKSTYLFATPNTLRGEQISVENNDFTQALAQLTTELMNAGELDNEKVKEILEG